MAILAGKCRPEATVALKVGIWGHACEPGEIPGENIGFTVWPEWGLSLPWKVTIDLVALPKLFNLSVFSSSGNRHSNGCHLMRWLSG